MAAVEIPKELMIKKLDPMNKWHQLGLTNWSTQLGLIKEFNQTDAGIGDYYCREKSHKKLWDFILYVSSTQYEIISKYFELPDDIYYFIHFCFNDVAAKIEWKEANRKKEQMDYFPYEKIYNEVWLLNVNKSKS